MVQIVIQQSSYYTPLSLWGHRIRSRGQVDSVRVKLGEEGGQRLVCFSELR